MTTIRDACTPFRANYASRANRDASGTTFPQVVTHVTRTPNITENQPVTRVTRSPMFRLTHVRTYTGEGPQ